jgi:ketosteroid isomerase-like protein
MEAANRGRPPIGSEYCCAMPASLELVKIALQAYGSGDSEIALALAGPHIRWDERASRPEGDLVWGRDKVERAMRRYLDGWAEYRFDVEDIAEVGPGKIVGICRERGKPTEGPAVDRRFGGLWLVEEGKIVSWATYLTPREAVRAAKELLGGRLEQPKVNPALRPTTDVPAKPAALPEPPAPPPSEPADSVSPEAPDTEASQPFDFESPGPIDAPALERPRKKILTKSEEQKRAARARAKLRKLASRQSA